MNGNVMEIVLSVVQLLAGMGVFLFGIHSMSQGLEKSASRRIRKLFDNISNNRLAGVGVGTLATGIIQSSTAVSVMTMGLVNAGLMSLFQATTIIMGANIGTTLSAFLFALRSFDLSAYLMLLAPIGLIMSMLDKRENISKIGEALIGIGLIFIGLEFMSDSFKDSQAINAFLLGLFKTLQNPLVLILLGTLVTGVLQSSSLVTGLIILLIGDGSLTPAAGFYLILGSNIGTCFTALIASIGANINAKRTAVIHFMYNIIGVAVFAAFMIPLEPHFMRFFSFISGGIGEMQIAMFHLVFNVWSVVVFLPVVKQFVWLCEKMVPEREKDKNQRNDLLDDRLLETPSVAVAQVLKQIIVMAKIAETNFDLSMSDVINNKDAHTATINKNETHLNYLNRAITNYLVKVSGLSISRADEQLIGSLYHVVSDLERIGDHAENFSETAQAIVESGSAMSDAAIAEITDMYQKIKLLYRDALYAFENRDDKMFKEVARREEEIDQLKKEFSDNHMERLRTGLCKIESGVMYYDIITNLERVADHLTNVAYSVRPRKVAATPVRKGGTAKA